MALDEFGLTLMQRNFCELYIANNGNGTKAAIDAGYSVDAAAEIASENLTKPKIKSYIKKKMNNVFEKINFGIEERAKILKETIYACKEGKTTKEGIYDAEGVYKGLDQANKMDGTYAPEVKAHLVEESTNGKVNEMLKDLEIKEY